MAIRTGSIIFIINPVYDLKEKDGITASTFI